MTTSIYNYVDSKRVKVEELRTGFKVVKQFSAVDRGLSECGLCDVPYNFYKMPSDSWSVVGHCTSCKAITVMFCADRMSENHSDYYEVFQEKGE